MIKAVVDGMIERKFGRIVNITSASVKSPIPQLGMCNGARAGLTGFVAGLARQVARHNVTINNLLPGPFLTDRLRSGAAHLGAAQQPLGGGGTGRCAARRTRPGASAIPPSSARPAPSCARRPRASSSGTTCCSTAAPSIPRSHEAGMDPTFLPAWRLAELTRAGTIGCLELLDHYIAPRRTAGRAASTPSSCATSTAPARRARMLDSQARQVGARCSACR